MDYPWYEKVALGSVGLHQGDLIPNCPIVIPPKLFNPMAIMSSI